MSQYGAKFIKNIGSLSVDGFDADIQFKENGYLFLSGDRSRHILEQNHRTQLECGANWIKKYQPSDLQKLFPWLNASEIAVATYSTENEGFFDPWLFLQVLRRKAVSLNVEVINGFAVGAAMSPVTNGSSSYNIDSILLKSNNSSSIHDLSAAKYVNAAGAWSGKLLDDFIATSNVHPPSGIRRLPVQPKKRCIFTIQCNSRAGGTNSAGPYVSWYVNTEVNFLNSPLLLKEMEYHRQAPP